MSVSPENFVARNGPKWLTPNTSAEKDSLAGLWMILVIVLILYICFVLLIRLLDKGVAAGVAAIERYDSKPVPQEQIPAPESPKIDESEAWRRATGFRYLEKLKQQVTAAEKLMRQLYQDAVDAHKHLTDSGGFLQYAMRKGTVIGNVEQIKELQEELPSLKEHVAKVFGGDVRSDVQELEEALQKLRLKKEHKAADLREVESKIPHEKDKYERDSLTDRKNGLRDSIREIEVELIEIESAIKELREFDFQKLYQELGVSPETMRVEATHLSHIKTKADLVSQIRPPHAVTATEKNSDDLKIEAAKERRRRDIRFDTEIRLGTKLQTLEEIQRWRKEQRRSVLEDNAGSLDDKEERLEEIDRAVEREKKRLRDNVEIYEEE